MIRKILPGILAVIVGVILIVLVLASEHALVVHPKGMVAQHELELIAINIILMLVIIIPTYILLFWVVWKYCITKKNITHDPDHTHGPIGELLMWGLPTLVVIVMSLITWEATHRLNPYKPLESETKPLVVQVIALNWKWLFIYPELGIATLNHLQIPERTPIHLNLAADGSPMNSFWIPQLSGQIYAMTGMRTQLYLIADAPGSFVGRAIEINGEGYADMTFPVISSSQNDFDDWVAQVKKSSHHLTKDVYNELVAPAINKSVILFSEVENDLFHKIIHKYMFPTNPVL